MHKRTSSYVRTARCGNSQLLGQEMLPGFKGENALGEFMSGKLELFKYSQGINSVIISGAMVDGPTVACKPFYVRCGLI